MKPAEALTKWRLNFNGKPQIALSVLDGALRAQGLKPYVTGGMVRDAVLLGPSAVPRDIDIVVDGEEGKVFEALLSAGVTLKGRSYLGGLKCSLYDITFDIWTLDESAILGDYPKEERTIEKLLHYYPLNIETVAVALTPDGHTVDLGFSEAIQSKRIRLNSTAFMGLEKARERAMSLASRIGFMVDFPPKQKIA